MSKVTKTSSCEELMNYFDEVIDIRLEKDNPLPVDLEDVWRLGFFTKNECVKTMLASDMFWENEDYIQVEANSSDLDENGQPVKNYHISIGCLTFLILNKYLPSRMMFEAVKQHRQVQLIR